MNKKFSTLVAGFLLAGGLFSVNASTLEDAAKANDNHYYVINQVGDLANGTWTSFVAPTNDYVMYYNPTSKQVEMVMGVPEDKDNAYWRISDEDKDGLYTLTTKAGNVFSLKVADLTISEFRINEAAEGFDVFSFFTEESSTGWKFVGCEAQAAPWTLNVAKSTVRGFAARYIAGEAYTAEDLNAINGTNAGFNMTIGYLKDNKADQFTAYSLEGQVFNGTLKAVTNEIDKDVMPKITDDSYYLKNGDNYIVLLEKTWSDFNTSHTGATAGLGYRFATYSKTDLVKQLKKDALAGATPVIKATQFQISKNINDGEYIEVLAKDGTETVEVYVSNFSSKNYLTVNASATEKDAEYNTEDGKTYVKLGGGNLAEWKKIAVKDSYLTITEKKTGKVLGVSNCDVVGFYNSVQADMPEGMWAFTYNETKEKFELVNRESKAVYTDMIEYPLYVVDAENGVYEMGGVQYIIKAHAIKDLKEGYANFATKDAQYKLGVYSPVWGGSAYFVENHAGTHQIGLDINEENASTWKLIQNTGKAKYDEITDELTLGTDSIYVEHVLSYWKNDNDGWDTTKDTLKVVTYSIQNAVNGEYMGWDTDLVSCKEEYEAYGRFAFKKVGDNYNLVEVASQWKWNDSDKDEEVDEGEVSALPNASFYGYKVYGGDSADKGLLSAICMYDRTENDLISVDAIDAPEYLKLNMADTVKIFRSEYAEEQSNVLYEKGNFLGIGNAVEFDKINPAMFVDTAYTDSYRPEYLLAVDVNQVLKEENCNIPGHPHAEADTLFGRFLVSFADSAIANTNLHANKYVYDDKINSFAKLGFVEGFHTEDTLFLPESEGKIGVRTAKPTFGKYAFRIVDNKTNEFVIEAAYKPLYTNAKIDETPGYIRNINGTIVISRDYQEAERFCLVEDDRTPTANEDVEVSEVSIVAVNGSVIVKGAAGKTVAISNILGQTIANAVVSSDNATIAVPAGIAVVAVEGEEAVKVVVK